MNCTRRWCHRAGFTHQASSTSTSVTSPIRPGAGLSELDPTNCLARAIRSWLDGAKALLRSIGPNGRLITELVPELKLIVGDQPPIPELPPRDAQRRFQLSSSAFLSVFARPEQPLALSSTICNGSTWQRWTCWSICLTSRTCSI